MDQLDEVKRGEEAERLLNHPLIAEAFIKVKDGIFNAMGQAPMGDEKTHNRLVIALQLVKQIEKQLHDVATTGKMAALQLNDSYLQKLKQRI